MKDKAMQGNKRRASQHSSVWIDPALSLYFSRKAEEQNPNRTSFLEHPLHHPAQTAPSLPAHAPQKQPGADNARRRNPTTPVPPRASAQPPGNITVRPRYSRGYTYPAPASDITRMPTLPPPTMWEYESPDFQAGSSLSALSLVVDAPTIPDAPVKRAQRAVEIAEHDTLPPPPTQRRELTIDEIQTIPPAPARRAELAIEEIDIIPSPKPRQHVVTIDEIDTIPERTGQGTVYGASDTASSRAGNLPGSALMSIPSVIPLSPTLAPTTSMQADASSSWTAGGAAQSRYAQRIAERKGGKGIVWYGSQDASTMTRGRSPFRHPADRLRWWLLRPGHIEFALWIGGTILLMVVTAALLLATTVSLFWSSPHLATTQASSASTAAISSSPAGNTTTRTLILNESGPLVVGQALHLRGQGFTPRATIRLTHDQGQPCQPGSVQADTRGTFSVTLDDSTWTTGAHRVTAQDAVSGRAAALTITLAPDPIGKNTAATPTPAATTTTPVGGVQSTPVNAGPTATPTPRPTATSTPSPTPTPGITPTVSPTSGTTPSTGTPGTNNPTSMSLDMAAQSAPIRGSWLWLLIALGCSAALLMLGVVGAMRRRDRV